MKDTSNKLKTFTAIVVPTNLNTKWLSMDLHAQQLLDNVMKHAVSVI